MPKVYPPILAPAMQRIDELESKVAILENQLNKVLELIGGEESLNYSYQEYESEQTAQTTTQVIPNSRVEQPVQAASSTPPQTQTTLYCSLPIEANGKVIFPTQNLSTNSMDSAYKLEIEGNEAKFYLMSGERAFEILTEDISFNVDAVAETENDDEFDDIETLEPGKAILTSNGWEVVEKAKITFVGKE